ncbi:zinc finger CCCH domain-containing protein 6 isoform X2 [Magnolia sinica]|nr:zinc finger CCCH domain-containing protein 6 isoform X2 [Magnolia sinica]XP_058098792.1 zinc finger CCCH domain-containing protein 6 isoform X2 [Magnolia sinica]
MGSDDQPPPGFEGPQVAALQIPLITWQCPPRLLLNRDWQVVAGDESKEVEVENQRQLRVLEAVYPRPSAIPPSPSVSSEVNDYPHDDRQTPLIPITPIEDDDSTDSSDSAAPVNAFESSQLPGPPKCFPPVGGTTPLLMDIRPAVEQSQGNALALPTQTHNERSAIGIVPGVEPDVVAAASAAFTAIMRSNEEGSLIDRDLLIKILSNPKLLEQLVKEHGLVDNPQITSKPTPVPATIPTPVPTHINRMESDVSPSAPSTEHFYPMTNNPVIPTLNPRPPPASAPAPAISQITSMPAVKAPPVRDINYYKNLIQQHGGEKHESHNQAQAQLGNRHNHHSPVGPNLDAVQSSKQRDSRPKISKPCSYFNSASGCRHGANCMYQHDVPFQPRVGGGPEAQSAKRMKLEREITGRT